MIRPPAEKINSILNRNPVLFTLILSGLAGFCLGLSTATWQVAVETGQVLAGIVEYPADNPNYMYHLKAFTIVAHFSALLLRLLGSEKIVSIIISGLLGMVSFQALSMLIFAINRNIYISVLGAIFIYFTNYLGSWIRYPIILLGNKHTYGVLGLSFIVLVIALIGAKAYRLGLFCLGLAPCIHASWGSWLFLIISLSALFQFDSTKKVVRAYYWYFIAGISIVVLSLIYQLYLMQALPVIDPEIKKQYLDSFVKYWSEHRKPFYWDYAKGQFSLARKAVIFCIYSIIAGLLSLIYLKKEGSLSFIFRLIIISGILSLLIAGITHLPPENVPAYLLMAMLGRYINLNNIVLTAALLGILTHCNNRHYRWNYYAFLLLLVGGFFHQRSRIFLIFPIISLYLPYLALNRHYSAAKETSSGLVKPSGGVFRYVHTLIEKADFRLVRKGRFSYGKTLLCIMAIFLLINLPKEDFVRRFLVRQTDFRDRTNDASYSKISERKGMILTTADFFLISLKTRRPVLVKIRGLNALMIVPESGDILNNILKKIYGVSLLNAPPDAYRNKAIIPSELYRDLWEKRTVKEWQEIRKEFGACDVLTKPDWKLLLPVVFKDERMVLYEIPANGAQ